ncbi:UNVERIFIED_CONTAM: hypothetical protein FKN15_049089 [Acipenser sinensis]
MSVLDAVIRRYSGSTHDSFIWVNCDIGDRFASGDIVDVWLLGDSGYVLQPWLLTPILHPSNRAEGLYNAAHKRERCVMEKLFGILKMRFRCIDKSRGCLLYTIMIMMMIVMTKTVKLKDKMTHQRNSTVREILIRQRFGHISLYT